MIGIIAEIETVLCAGDGAAGFVGQCPLKTDTVGEANARYRTLQGIAGYRSAIRNIPRIYILRRKARARETDAVPRRTAGCRGLSTPRYRSCVCDRPVNRPATAANFNSDTRTFNTGIDNAGRIIVYNNIA